MRRKHWLSDKKFDEGDQTEAIVGHGLIGGYFKDRRYWTMLIG